MVIFFTIAFIRDIGFAEWKHACRGVPARRGKKVGHMLIGAKEITMLLALASFVAACRALGRACFVARPDGAASRIAVLWAVAFLVQVLGTLMMRGMLNEWAWAVWGALVVAVAAAGSTMLGRRWRERGMEREAEKVRVRTLDGPPPAAATDAATVAPDGPAATVDLQARVAAAARAYDLTRREEDVLALLIEGHTAQEVTEMLVVSPNTVKTHVRNLYRKLGINRRCDLASRLGL